MKLTKRKALEESIKIWSKLAETGKTKEWYHSNIEKIFGAYGKHACPLCVVYMGDGYCKGCPLSAFEFEGICELRGQPYAFWLRSDTIKERKKYASQILAILRKALRKLDRKKPKRKL